MFWHYVFNNNSAHIEKLLEKQNLTLKELMDEDELLQECQAQNKKLIDFLSNDSILQELVSLVVTEPNSEMEYKTRFKYSSLAAELLSAEVPAIVDKLSSSPELLNILCNFLLNEKPLNPLLASFFSKVFSMLMNRRAEQDWYQYQVACYSLLDFLKESPDFISKIVHHIGTSAIMNLLHKLMCGIEEEEIRNKIHMWLSETPLMSLLVAKLSPENDWCEQASTEQIICDLLDSGMPGGMMLPGGQSVLSSGMMFNSISSSGSTDNVGSSGQSKNLLLPLLMNESTVNQLVSILLNESSTSTSTTHVTNVLIKMLLRHGCKRCGTGHSATVQPPAPSEVTATAEAPATNSPEEAPASSPSSRSSISEESSQFCVAQSLLEALPQIHNMLTRGEQQLVETSYGVKTERLGTTRLRLIALIMALISTKHIKIHQKISQLQTIPLIINLFFKFSQNNFLHTLVDQCLVGLISEATPSTPSTTVPPQVSPGVEAMDTNPPVVEAAPETKPQDSPKAEGAKTGKEGESTEGEVGVLLSQLFTEAKIVQKILACYEYECCKGVVDVPSGSLCGYRGHIRLVANAISQQSTEGPNKPHITSLIQSLPDDVKTAWEDFTMNKLPEINNINLFTAPNEINEDMLHMSNDDLNLSFDDNGYNSSEIGSGVGAECLSSPTDDKSSTELFEKMCSSNFLQQFQDLNSMWDDKEKNISFSDDATDIKKSEDSKHSSDEEEEENQGDNSMEVDELEDDWESVFDRRANETKKAEEGNKNFSDEGDSIAGPIEAFNPWDTATATDISEADTPPIQSANPWNPFPDTSFDSSKKSGETFLAFEATNEPAFAAFNAFRTPTDTNENSNDSKQPTGQSPFGILSSASEAAVTSDQQVTPSTPFNAFQDSEEKPAPASTNPFTADFSNQNQQADEADAFSLPVKTACESQKVDLSKEPAVEGDTSKDKTQGAADEPPPKPTTKF